MALMYTNRRRRSHHEELSSNLYLEFCGEEFVLDRAKEFSFGRSGDLVIDDNPYMHRVVGRFRNIDGTWRLENRSSRQAIEIRDATGPSVITLAPRKAAALLFGDFTCRFSAGPAVYEICGSLEAYEWEDDLLGKGGTGLAETVDWGRVDLNDDQKLLLVVMCESALRDPNAADGPVIPNRQAARRLGWPITKFNRKLDHLCEKLQRAGVPGVRGDVGGSALDRRRRLVEHSLSAPLVTRDDLALLDQMDVAN